MAETLRQRIDRAERELRESFDEQARRWKQCDVCGEMKPNVKLIHVYHAGDTSACEDCRNTSQ